MFSAQMELGALFLYAVYFKGFSSFLYCTFPLKPLLSFANHFTVGFALNSHSKQLYATMPSDLAKKKAAKKKEAAKARQRTKKPEEVNEEADLPDTQQNGAESNGEKRTH